MTEEYFTVSMRMEGAQAWKLLEKIPTPREASEFMHSTLHAMADPVDFGSCPYRGFETFLMACRIQSIMPTVETALLNLEHGQILMAKMDPAFDEDLLTFINYQILAAGMVAYPDHPDRLRVVEQAIEAAERAIASPSLPKHRLMPTLTSVALLAEARVRETDLEEHIEYALHAADRALPYLSRSTKHPHERSMVTGVLRVAAEMRYRKALDAADVTLMQETVTHLSHYHQAATKFRDSNAIMSASLLLGEAKLFLAGECADGAIAHLLEAEAHFAQSLEASAKLSGPKADIVHANAPDALYRIQRVLMAMDEIHAPADGTVTLHHASSPILDLLQVFSDPLSADDADEAAPLDNGQDLTDNVAHQ